jgi:hypothetical protein
MHDPNRDDLDEAQGKTDASSERAEKAVAEMVRLGDMGEASRKADDERRTADDARRAADDDRRVADDGRRAADDKRRDATTEEG